MTGKTLPFSQLQDTLDNYKSAIPGCLVDTQLLVALIYEPHTFNEDATSLLKILADYQIPIFATVTTRSEFVDLNRRIIITEALMSIQSEGDKSNWDLTKEVKQQLKKHKLWIDTQANNDLLPVLSDYRIKECKEVFFPIRQSGKSGWTEICKYYLEGKILKFWELLVEKLNINYLDLRDGEMQEFFSSKLEWEKMYSIMEKSCLSSSDSMIANVLFSSTFPFAVTADYDLAYAVEVSDEDKKVFVPDRLYKQKFKSKKFK